ncbi:CvpA family protein [Edaphobacter modestus]|uniref:Membrane protein required for colicin V production n=1 Tax=Edaphobacter modestus TaxID=388466 RepID=A0A4Q7YRT7_9BACT|nr:CvpA family protein [Edaphobacter modestus]RZU39894.1 membrane protein required for colicin V production [Edaphobacter modestus]
MNALDWLLIVILALSAIQAFFRGLVLELFSLAGLVCGIVLAAWNYSRLAEKMAGVIQSAAIASVVSFLLIAIGVMVIAAVLGRVIHASAHAIGLGFFDRLGGAAFGLVRGGMLGVAILMALTAFLPAVSWLKNSRLAPYFLAGSHAVSFVVPHDLEQLILAGGSELKHNAHDWIKSRP